MKTVQLVYTCDAWHTQASKELFGVYSTKGKAIQAINKANPKFTINELSNLSAFNQTQGLETNYLIDAATVNP